MIYHENIKIDIFRLIIFTQYDYFTIKNNNDNSLTHFLKIIIRLNFDVQLVIMQHLLNVYITSNIFNNKLDLCVKKYLSI